MLALTREIYYSKEMEVAQGREKVARRRTPSRLKKLGVAALTGIIGAPTSIASFVALDSAVTAITEPYIAPGVTRISSAEQCSDAEAVVVTLSSMGMNVAAYTGNNIKSTVEARGGCVLATDYGNAYGADSQTILSHKVTEAIENLSDVEGNSRGQPYKIVLHGQSFGGIAALDLWQSDAFERAREKGMIVDGGLIMESTPSGPESVHGGIAMSAVMEASKLGIPVGKRTLGIINSFEALNDPNRDPLNKKTWDDVDINTKKTSPLLIRDQLTRISQGAQVVDIDAPVIYIGSPGDRVVDTVKAAQVFSSKIGHEAIAIYTITPQEGSNNHAGGWLIEELPNYKAAYRGAYNETIGSPRIVQNCKTARYRRCV